MLTELISSVYIVRWLTRKEDGADKNTKLFLAAVMFNLKIGSMGVVTKKHLWRNSLIIHNSRDYNLIG